MKQEDVIKTGTTTVAIMCKDGVVLAADKRATAGNFIAHKKTEKIYNVTDDIAVTMAGVASDAQLLIKIAKAELMLKRLRTKKNPTVREAANLMSRMVYENIRKFSLIPGISHFLIGGVDDKGYHVYDCFADGSLEKIEDYISSGSGSVMAYGVLETLYKKGLSLDEGVKLALKCINAAIQRDSASGDGLDVVTITKDGAKKILEKDLRVKIEV